VGSIKDILNFPTGSIIKAPIKLNVESPNFVGISNKFYNTEVQTQIGTPSKKDTESSKSELKSNLKP